MRPLLLALALALAACTPTPRGLLTPEDYRDWKELRHDRDRDPADGAPGPAQPGRVEKSFAEPDWRYGELNPPMINPDALVDGLDVAPQLGNTPFGGRLWNVRGKRDVDLLIYGSSEDVDPRRGAGQDGGFEASGAAVIRIPF